MALHRFASDRLTSLKDDDMSTCLTPGAEYLIGIGDRRVSVCIDLPKSMADLDLTANQAYILEDELHDAMEQVMARYFSGVKRKITVTAPQIDAAKAIVRRAEKAGLPVPNGIRWLAGFGAPNQRRGGPEPRHGRFSRATGRYIDRH